MTRSEIRLAFDNLEARARAQAGTNPLDRISLRDHVVEVEIGAFQEERGRLQRIAFNVVVEVLPIADPLEDDVDRILSYDTITEAIDAELEAERLNLLETLAARIADRILADPQAARVFVRVEKLDRGPGALGVEIERSAAARKPQVVAGRDIAPLVVCLGNAALASPYLRAWIDELAALARPVVLAVGPAGTAPNASQPLAQRRIDLLAMEQNAWVLAGRDARCIVIGTRTELDHAAKMQEIAVWAPSKMVLDAVHGPGRDIRDPIALAGWFAAEIGATEIVGIGTGPGAGLTRHFGTDAPRLGLSVAR